MYIDIVFDRHGAAWQIDRHRGTIVGPATPDQTHSTRPQRPQVPEWHPQRVRPPDPQQLQLLLSDARRALEQGRAA